MNKTMKIFWLCVIIIFSSCQKDDLENRAAINVDYKSILEDGITNRSESSFTDQELLEIHLRWTSFLVADLLKNDSTERNRFTALLSNGNKILNFKDLYDDLSFSANFNALLRYYADSRPDDENDPPDPPLTTVTKKQAGRAQAFLDFILNDNCIELYFPKGLDFSLSNNEITSTGHPINLEMFNDGVVSQLNSTSGFFDPHPIVNMTYVNANQNIIIARPHRTSIANCTYSEYSNINFELFLDY